MLQVNAICPFFIFSEKVYKSPDFTINWKFQTFYLLYPHFSSIMKIQISPQFRYHGHNRHTIFPSPICKIKIFRYKKIRQKILKFRLWNNPSSKCNNIAHKSRWNFSVKAWDAKPFRVGIKFLNSVILMLLSQNFCTNLFRLR